MDYLDGKIFVEIEGKRHTIHSTDKNFLGIRKRPNFLRTKYQVQNETKIRKNQKVAQNIRRKKVKRYPKRNNNPIFEKPK